MTKAGEKLIAAANEANEMVHDLVKRFSLTPELYAPQSHGRPEWQKRLTAHQRRELDLMANESHKSQEAYERYVAYTEVLRQPS